VLVLCAIAEATGPPVLTVHQNPSPEITLDGRLDEAAWKDAPVLRLTQQAPRPGAPSPFQTEVRVVVTPEKLYFGFTCRDPQPHRIAIHTMQHDGDMSGDDTVSFDVSEPGVPVLVNTSFNTRGEPIVNTPRDALESFWTSPLDALVIGSFLIEKNGVRP